MASRRALSVLATCAALVTSQEFSSLDTKPVEGVIRLPPAAAAPGMQPLLPSTKITLNGGEYEAFSRVDGGFTFHDVKPGVYLLDVLSDEAMFSQVKINLPTEPEGKVRCLEYRYPGAPKQPTSYPLNLVAHTKIRYFEPKPTLSIASFMKNPMAYMMLFTLFVVIVFPKMMNSMDPEQMKEMQEQMQGNDPSALFSQLLSGNMPEPPKPAIKEKKSRK
mmetsp:Transcript_28313/g.58065  ORF Transcript_28313/g.58065 Transcript_28313/m.58065 type:complete len:219 (-) Transcript_28313:99-755(-)|eukprot:CAMPEP_0182542414 /NCGR_PEP_ID=MMETSP1323-20130603/30097_1 /TAXON_ID=236787 /ORGANISM="Florenciella parvula, Strain RCC1693" /LENGTH=218 /DNA_ID=CAMNT_0024753263 /DNA_START=40 /DNA_END=696 /DNA_ORIENTATION=-